MRDVSSPKGYVGNQPYGMVPELVHAGVMTDWLKDDDLWVPQSDRVSFKPVLFNTGAGYFVNLLRMFLR